MPSPAVAAGEWIELFNGRDLSGWTQHGGKAPFVVEDGVITGTTLRGEPNSFLCTDAEWDDFELELEFLVDPRMNSGVQFRSQVFPGATEARDLDGKPILDAKGLPITIPAGRVHGYQCEIDINPARNRWWTAGIYDEARRGWLYPGPAGGDAAAFTNQGRDLDRPGAWNHLRIVAHGPRIRTSLNGQPRAGIHDALNPRGLIALQVHEVSGETADAGMQVRFRHIRLRPLSAP